ncbi:hypothetical protein AAZX31_04G119100 [Glycine max]
MVWKMSINGRVGMLHFSMAAIAHSYMLEVLELDNCSLLTSVSLDLPRLQTIRLVHCRKQVSASFFFLWIFLVCRLYSLFLFITFLQVG